MSESAKSDGGMNDQQESNSHIVLTCAAIGAVAGFLLQGAMAIWAVMEHGPVGIIEMLVMFVIASAVAIVGALAGSVLGLIIKVASAIMRKE